MIDFVDIIYGLSWGDEGKGKITNALAENYDYVCRWNGGPNAGHTVYVDGVKYKTHIVPSGIFKDKVSVIGPGCVFHVDQLMEEINYLSTSGFDMKLIKVSPKAHVITDKHIQYDIENLQSEFGTTGKGIAPCYSDKMLRKGIRASEVLSSYILWDEKLKGRVLCEGAQSVNLDVDHGDYPYVTSSSTMPYSACSLGFSPRKIRRMIGVAKAYDTRVGNDPILFPDSLWDDETLNAIIEEGKEYGSTTGRKRKANWLNLDRLIHAINISGTTEVIINKCDVLEKIDVFKVYYNNNLNHLQFFESFKVYIQSVISENTEVIRDNIIFSGDVENI